MSKQTAVVQIIKIPNCTSKLPVHNHRRMNI